MNRLCLTIQTSFETDTRYKALGRSQPTKSKRFCGIHSQAVKSKKQNPLKKRVLILSN
jgi:hypothetical protein